MRNALSTRKSRIGTVSVRLFSIFSENTRTVPALGKVAAYTREYAKPLWTRKLAATPISWANTYRPIRRPCQFVLCWRLDTAGFALLKNPIESTSLFSGLTEGLARVFELLTDDPGPPPPRNSSRHW